MAGSERVTFRSERDQVPEDGRQHYDSIHESRGGVRGPFPVLLNSPELAGRVGHLGAYVRYESELSDPDRELTILATARTFECAFEWAAHRPIAERAGVPARVIEAVADEAPLESFDEPEALIVTYVRSLLLDHEVDDATFHAAMERFGESGVVEFTATVGYYTMLACVLNALEVVPDEGEPSFD